jgi:adenylosuccinate synthase
MGDTTKIVIAYEVTDLQGNTSFVEKAPGGNARLLRCKPVYQEFRTWGDDIKSKRAIEYFGFVEKFLDVPITMIGTGPGRDDLAYRRNGKHEDVKSS